MTETIRTIRSKFNQCSHVDVFLLNFKTFVIQNNFVKLVPKQIISVCTDMILHTVFMMFMDFYEWTNGQ